MVKVGFVPESELGPDVVSIDANGGTSFYIIVFSLADIAT